MLIIIAPILIAFCLGAVLVGIIVILGELVITKIECD